MPEDRLSYTIEKSAEMPNNDPPKRRYTKRQSIEPPVAHFGVKGRRGVKKVLPAPFFLPKDERRDLIIVDETPWDRLAEETIEEYSYFLTFKNLGIRRTVKKAFCKIMEDAGDMIPGQPLMEGTDLIREFYRMETIARRWLWVDRARAWDEANYDEIVRADEEFRRKVIAETIEEHKKGWELFRLISLKSVYQTDEDGNYILDENGRPRMKEIEDPVAAARVYKQATTGERTALGIPTEILVMSENEIRSRYAQIQQELRNLTSGETVDAEYIESDIDFEDTENGGK